MGSTESHVLLKIKTWDCHLLGMCNMCRTSVFVCWVMNICVRPITGPLIKYSVFVFYIVCVHRITCGGGGGGKKAGGQGKSRLTPTKRGSAKNVVLGML